MIPSLLFLDSEEARTTLEKNVFTDLHIDKLIGEKTMQILSLPCSKNELLLRHRLFQKMEDASFRDSFLSLLQTLTYLFQAHDAFLNAKNECETLFSFVAYADRYREICAMFASLDLKEEDFSDFSAYCSSLPPIGEQLTPALAALEKPLFDIKTSKLWFSADGSYAQTDQPSDGFIDRMLRYSDDLNLYELKLPTQREIRADQSLFDAIFLLYPEQITALRAFLERFSPLLSPDILKYREEIGFYRNIYELKEKAEGYGIHTAYPSISDSPVFVAKNAYDVTLIAKECHEIIPNDLEFTQPEGFFFLTGANGGGKTTYLRCVAVNLIFGLAGCPVFCDEAELYPFRAVFTHFPGDEVLDSGRFAEEEARVRSVLEKTDQNSFLFFNETFSGTNDKKGLSLTVDCAKACIERQIFGLFVTHFHEVCDYKIPVLSTVVDADDENKRTYRIQKNSGLRSSYAEDILRKYSLSKDTLHTRDEVAK